MFRFFQKSLLNQLVGSFSALFLITLSAVTLTAYIRARQTLQESIFERLNVAVSLKEYELKQWFREQRNDTLLIAQSPTVQSHIEVLSKRPLTPKAKAVYQVAYKEIESYFDRVLKIKSHLQDISLLSVGGIVILSTDQGLEGMYQGLGNLTTYFEPNDSQIIPNFYKSPLNQQAAITLATPVLNPQGKRIAVITVNLNLKAVDDLIREKTGLGSTGKTYLVGKLANQHVLIAGDPLQEINLEDEVKSLGIDAAMEGMNGEALYLNYQKIPVVGVYRWVKTENFALIAEMEQKEAFQPATVLSRDTIVIGLISSGILLIAVYWLARQLSSPVLTITQSAAAIEAGDFQSDRLDRVKKRQDELGQLARVFQQMAREVQHREERLKQQVAELKIEIDQSKRSQQVSEVTDTQYFRDLQQRSRDLRERRKRGNDPKENVPKDGEKKDGEK